MTAQKPHRSGGRVALWATLILVALLLSGLLGFALAGGFSGGGAGDSDARQPTLPRGQPATGHWARQRASSAEKDARKELTDEQRAKIEELSALGYAGGVQPGPANSGVTAYDREHTAPGYNLYVSGHAREAILIDLEGQPLHRWQVPELTKGRDQEAVMSEGDVLLQPRHDFLSVVHLYENGDLLAVLGNTGISKVDRDSNVIWERANGSHHDASVAEDGTIYVLTLEALVMPEIHPTEPVLIDSITVLDPDGNELNRLSIYAALRDSEFSPLLQYRPGFGDFLHTNTIEVLDGRLESRSPAFRRGNVLISIKHMSTIAVVDLEAGKVVWALAGHWLWQHRPTVLDNGHILIFDNLGGRRDLGASRVIEFDPFSQENVWIYEGTPGNILRSVANGTVQRLPNGNTLIVESHNGRALEVTPEKQIVWEFVNPHRAAEDEGLIAVLFDLVRLPPGFPTDWL